jgi:hypothetical protein
MRHRQTRGRGQGQGRRLKDRRRTRRSRQRGGAVTTVSQWREAADNLRTTVNPNTLIANLKAPELELPADNGSYLVSYDGDSLTLQYIATSLIEKFTQSEIFGGVNIGELSVSQFQELLRRESPMELFSVVETLALTESFLTGQAKSPDSIKSGDMPFYSLVLYANGV